MSKTDHQFAGSIPETYEDYLVPLIFEGYALDLAARVGARKPLRILELAAGTGVLTRALARELPANVAIVATDLNQSMLDHAAKMKIARPIDWRQADAMALPFPNESFDVVVCQFGAMFFPGRPQAYSETRRVLKAGGFFLFNVWDRIEENDFANLITNALAEFLPDNPPRFLARTPHGYHDLEVIREDLVAAGFDRSPGTTTFAKESRAESARAPAVAYCEGTPLRNEIEAHAAVRLEEATDFAAAAIAQRFGTGPVVGKIQAHVIVIQKL